MTPWPHGLQHTRLPGPSPSPGLFSNSYSFSQWCYPTISCSVAPFYSCPQSFQHQSFPVSQLFIKWPKYWSFSFSICPSNEYSGLISFRNWLVWSPGSPRDSQKSSPTTQFKSINSLALSPYYGPTLTSILTTYKADIWGMSMLLWLEQPLWLSPMAQCRKGRQKWLFSLFLWRVEYINTLQEKKIEIDSLYLHIKKLEKEQTKAKFRRRKTVKKRPEQK